MNIKRLILILLTILTITKVALSLLDSLQQPQIQSRLQLYQTNIVLHASQLQTGDYLEVSKFLTGEQPYTLAQKQYEQARESALLSLTQLQNISIQTLASNNPIIEVDTSIKKLQDFIEELNIKIGILQAQQDNTVAAVATWTAIPQEFSKVLQNLWSPSPVVTPNTKTLIETHLVGWFRYAALNQLYEVTGNQEDLQKLQIQEDALAEQAIIKLGLLSVMPLILGVIGVGILIFLIAQWWMKAENSIVAIGKDLAWETPWDGEVIWQVLIVGFFFIGEYLIPLAFSLMGFDPTHLSLRDKAFYVLESYLLMAAGGIAVLYLTIKPFFPLPSAWFNFRLLSKWFIWGLGGYLVALPVVIIVSLINEQIWHGQGGSNPIILLALQSQDKIAIAIFFVTAAIAAPIFEEIIFRGFLLSSLTRYLPVSGAILVSSLIFALAHLSFSEVLPLTTLGCILGFVYTKSRNLLSSILLHSLWNSGTLISLIVLGSGGTI